MNIEIRVTDQPRILPEGPLGFGKIFTNHVFLMDWAPGRGWHRPRIDEGKALALEPAAAILHYAQAIFEGLKAHRGVDGKVRLFRPDRHAARMVRSAERLCIPPVPPEMFIESVRALVELEKAWVPAEEGASLYIRPFAFANEPFLGVRPAQSYLYSVLVGPVGAYYAKGFAPVRIWVERSHVRAAPGGLGEAKTPANYAASLQAAELARARGYDQVLWTDAVEHGFIEEVGTMNVFVHLDDEVVTPSLDGTILPGVTRESVITLLRARGLKVSERRLSLDEVLAAHARRTLHEVFGTGTAAVVSPVGSLGLEAGSDLTIGDGQPGPLSKSLLAEITAIHRGEAEDRWGWTQEVG